MTAQFDQLLTLDLIEANTRALAAEKRDDVVVTQVGESRFGRPIEMISIGEGERNALIVGVPHPNEPAGAITVERLIGLMTGPDGDKHQRGYRWHFIKAIDPEGLRLNEGWVGQPLSPKNYFAHYFRPALNRQPESTFPFIVGDYEFQASTIENRAYQKAFELTRPVLHASLHHADYGGAVHLMSRNEPGLVPLLDQVTLDHGQIPMQLEVPGLPIEYVGKGVALFPAVPDVIEPIVAAGGDPFTAFPCGELSPGYGEAQYGTFTIITEVPLWDDPRLRDERPSSFTVRDAIAFDTAKFAALDRYLQRHIAALKRPVDDADGAEIVAAVEEFETQCRLFLDMADQQLQRPDVDRVLATGEYWWRRNFALIIQLRMFGLLRRLADLQIATAGDEAARDAHAEAIATADTLLEELQPEKLETVPVMTMTGIQMDAILAAADYLNRRTEKS